MQKHKAVIDPKDVEEIGAQIRIYVILFTVFDAVGKRFLTDFLADMRVPSKNKKLLRFTVQPTHVTLNIFGESSVAEVKHLDFSFPDPLKEHERAAVKSLLNGRDRYRQMKSIALPDGHATLEVRARRA